MHVTILVNGRPAQPGIIPGGSSHYGHYVGKAVIETALGFGWHDEHAAGAAETYDEWYHRSDWAYADHWHDMVEDAERFLDASTEGGVWHSEHGDFRLDAVEDCPRCGWRRWSDPDRQEGLEDCTPDGHLFA
jgi:hypothetical protein